MTATDNTATSECAEPSPSFLRKLEKLADDAVRSALKIPEKPASEKLKPLTPKQRKQIQEIEDRVIADYKGDITQLEAALGMLRIGHHFGWKVLYVVHSKRTIRNYEQILGVRIRDIFDPEGPSSYRSFGYSIVRDFKNFWKAIGGDVKIPHKQAATN